jgi:hypothetical protein
MIRAPSFRWAAVLKRISFVFPVLGNESSRHLTHGYFTLKYFLLNSAPDPYASGVMVLCFARMNASPATLTQRGAASDVR